MTIAFDIHRHSPALVRRSVGQRSHSAIPKAHLGDLRMPTEIEHMSPSGAKILVFGPFRLMPRLDCCWNMTHQSISAAAHWICPLP
jgi:hypothetical protein